MADKKVLADHFWKNKKLSEMTKDEWESLCDGCGRCCLNKIEYTDTKEICYTNVACKLLDSKTAKCSDYKNRKTKVPDCIKLSPRNLKNIYYMPDTCAYRLLLEGKDLLSWHPLLNNNKDSVFEAGVSVRGKTVSESDFKGELDDYIIDWIKSQ